MGELVFIKSDRSKSKARDSYCIISLNNNKQLATVQKFPMTNFRHHPILYPANASWRNTSKNKLTDDPAMSLIDPCPNKIIKRKSAKYTPSSSKSETEIQEENDETYHDTPFLNPPEKNCFMEPFTSETSSPNNTIK